MVKLLEDLQIAEFSRPSKPTGTIGVIEVSVQTDGAKAEFQEIQFPRTKEEVEEFIVRGFLRTAESQKIFPASQIKASQNAQDDFDFTIDFDNGVRRSLELMEVAPLEHLRCSFDSAPPEYRPYDFSQHLLTKILAKSGRYKGSVKTGLFLLVYITAWQFILSRTVLALLQYWTVKEPHCFEAIFCYSPTTAHEGITQLIYPTPKEFWNTFNPEQYRKNFVLNLDPKKWQIL